MNITIYSLDTFLPFCHADTEAEAADIITHQDNLFYYVHEVRDQVEISDYIERLNTCWSN